MEQVGVTEDMAADGKGWRRMIRTSDPTRGRKRFRGFYLLISCT